MPVQLIQKQVDTAEALEVVDDLRRKIESGEIRWFAAVGVDAVDVCSTWQAATTPTTYLRGMGALWHLLHEFSHGMSEDA